MFLQSQPRLLLGSSSVYRRELLQRLGLTFECAAPDIDETPYAQEPADTLAARLARSKATKLSGLRLDGWVIGSDQTASCDGRILGKPLTRERCLEQLSFASGKEVLFHTAVAIVAGGPGGKARMLEHCDHTRALFRPLTPTEIGRYIDRDNPLDCAGGFKCESLGIALFERIESEDPTALIGLPLIAVARMLRELGFFIP